LAAVTFPYPKEAVMSTTAPSDAVQDTLSDLLELMVEIKESLRQIASAVQTMSTASD
jgi:hypothetical protein